ncbi:MAG: S9 family peptidase [Planctomycetota bacterium]|jgi:dipeptidyl aminopeptidase/acylaminoacyl peptidase
MRSVVWLVLLAACGLPHRTHDARAFFETVGLHGASFSPDGKRLLVTSDESGVFNVYAQPVTGAPRRALTTSTTDHMRAVSYFPRDERILYTADRGGNELDHIYVRETSGKVIDLTPGEKLTADFLAWSRDDRSFFVLTNERDPQLFDLYRYAAKDYKRKLVYQNTGGYDVSAVSPDGRWLALTKVRSNRDSDIYVADLRLPDREPRHITPHKGDVGHSVAAFTPDSRRLWYLSNTGSEFARAWSFNLTTGRRAMEVAADWDVTAVSFSRDGRYRIVTINADAQTRVEVFDTQTAQAVELPVADGVRSVVVSRAGKRIAFYVNTDTSPSNLHVWNLGSRVHRQLTDTLNKSIRESDLVAADVVRYRSFDGRQIPALLYRPRQATDDEPVPALVVVHGGPGGQSRRGYGALRQFLVNHGYALLAVNNRGSSGYGKTFHHLDDRRHGEDDLMDCVFARSYLETLDWVDGGRVGILGGSYGGYMVAAALAFQPDAFDVGIDIFGVTNWVRTLKSIPPWWGAYRDDLYAELGDPEKDRERLERISPLLHAQNIKKPLLVVQGANDPRVLRIESDELVAAVRKNGVPVEYIVFPDEGHGFRRRENRITAAEAYLRFLNEHLK